MPAGNQMIADVIKRINAEQAAEEARNPLAAYSTRQLKAELERRDRQRRCNEPIRNIFKFS